MHISYVPVYYQLSPGGREMCTRVTALNHGLATSSVSICREGDRLP